MNDCYTFSFQNVFSSLKFYFDFFKKGVCKKDILWGSGFQSKEQENPPKRVGGHFIIIRFNENISVLTTVEFKALIKILFLDN